MNPRESLDGVAAELDRLIQRWHQLPLDQAVSAADSVFEAAQDIVDATAARRGIPRLSLPRLHEEHGPAVVMDQLRVVTFDASAAGVTGLADRLRSLRAALA